MLSFTVRLHCAVGKVDIQGEPVRMPQHASKERQISVAVTLEQHERESYVLRGIFIVGHGSLPPGS